MHALIGNQLLDGDIRVAERGVGAALVADFPVEDVVVMLAVAVRALGLALQVFAQHRGVRGHRLEGIDDHRQRLVFDLDEIGGVGRRIAALGDHESNFLILEQHLLLGQHRLDVAGERRHVMQVERLEVGRGQHREYARDRLGLGGVDRLDAGVAVRRTVEVSVKHSRQLQVVDVVALALDEADILDPLALAAHSLQAFRALLAGRRHLVHSAASCIATPLSLAAAN